MSYAHGIHIIGTFRIGSDTDAITATLTAIARIKNASVAEAQSLLSGGQDAIDKARSAGLNNDGRAVTRDNIYWKLKWHESNINSQRDKPNAAYANILDLKEWVGRAFQEYDVIQTGKAALERNWSLLWQDMGKNLAALPQNIRDAAGDGVEWLTGIPVWGWALGIGVLAFGAYKLALAAAPAAAHAYIGGRR
jgi:hypothetical protein